MAVVLISASGTGDESLTTTPTEVVGFNISEDASGAATVQLEDGQGGNVLVEVDLAADQNLFETFNHPITFSSGVHVDRTAGTTTVRVYVK